MNLKFKIKVCLFLGLFLVGCDNSASVKIVEGERNQSGITSELPELQLKRADELYIAIRDKNLEAIEQNSDKNMYREFIDDATALTELSAYIPYYEKLQKKTIIEHQNINDSSFGEITIVKFLYEYENRDVYYEVVFYKDDPIFKIVGVNLALVLKNPTK